jgi:predicted DNA-binding transcriptional regulator AlpA
MPTNIPETSTNILPRFIRMRDAPIYLGMDKNRFNKEVRPSLTELKIGTQSIAFDRHELDAWADDLINRIGKPGTRKQEKILCQKEHRVSPKGASFGTSTKSSKERDFTKALEQVTSKKQNAT